MIGLKSYLKIKLNIFDKLSDSTLIKEFLFIFKMK